MTNTERLIKSLEYAKQSGLNYVNFAVGKYTGNGSSVVSALRKRGFNVVKLKRAYYQLTEAV